MFTYNRRGFLRRFSLSFAIFLLSCLFASFAAAQDQTTYLPVPQGDGSDKYQDVISERDANADLLYVDETDLDFLNREIPDIDVRPPRRIPLNGGNYSVILIVTLLAVLLFLFLKFGAGGTLLRADPSAPKKPRKRAKAWGLTAAEQTGGDILASIRAMTSRRDALILLLRHCLVQAADETETVFRRSDTEREALLRLSQKWRRYPQLKDLMLKTELVHYGGRDISDQDFDTALKYGAQILMEGPARG